MIRLRTALWPSRDDPYHAGLRLPQQGYLLQGILPAGSAVTIVALDDTGEECFVLGDTVQGWAVEGWVSCSRLAAAPP